MRLIASRPHVGAALNVAIWMLSSVVLAQQPKAAVDQAIHLQQLDSGDSEAAQRAAKAIQQAVPKDREELVALADAVKSALSSTRDSAAECELRLALGRLAAAGVEDAAEWGFESMSVTHRTKTPPEVFDAHVRALEMVPGAAKELMIGNLDVALNFPEAEPAERQRIKEFVALTAEAMRTRELAEFLDALLTGEEDLFVKLEAPLEVRLIACYRRVKADPPINVDAIVEWLDKHPGGPAEVEVAALEAMSLVGTTKPDAARLLADRLLASRDSAAQLGRRLLAGHLAESLRPQILAALRKHAMAAKESDAAKVLAEIEKSGR